MRHYKVDMTLVFRFIKIFTNQVNSRSNFFQLYTTGAALISLIPLTPSTIFPSDIMRRIKGRVFQKIFAEFPHVKKRYWGRHFWARGYFCVTSGELTKDAIQEYLEHHFEKNPNDKFDIE